MTALEFLSSIDTYVIHMRGADDRYRRMVGNARYLNRMIVHDATRKEDVAWGDIKSYNESFLRALTHDYAQGSGLLLGLNIRQGCRSEKVLRRLSDNYAATIACRRSHLAAVKRGIDSGADVFGVMEDDALLRADVLQSIHHPQDADLVVYGGAFMRGAYRTDTKRYESSIPPTVKLLSRDEKKIRGRFLATMYVLTHDAAVLFHDVCATHHYLPIDVAWWYAMTQLNVYTVSPAAFTQDGLPSLRRTK